MTFIWHLVIDILCSIIKKMECSQIFTIPRLSNDMKNAAQKNNLGAQIFRLTHISANFRFFWWEQIIYLSHIFTRNSHVVFPKKGWTFPKDQQICSMDKSKSYGKQGPFFNTNIFNIIFNTKFYLKFWLYGN